jgi:phenylalanyl-tRNA synthetase beta chain
MRIPLSWLSDYIELTETPRQIADRLTFSGTEVEGIETIGSDFTGFLVAEVRAVERHPNADKLSVCRVFDGAQELQVVCGAPNVAAGGKYPFAPVGVTVPNGGFIIKKAKIRGVESFGMLCAADELGLSKDHSGLMVLDPKWAAGTPLATVLGPPETVLELEVTPNRPDCLSLLGIARELGAVYGKMLKVPSSRFQVSGSKTAVSVSVEDPAGCPRYTARLLENVTIGPSPDWMQKRLELAGIRAINNVVDITNYVMLECGQPLHAFDQELLQEGRIVVRRAHAGEKMATLDGQERELDPTMLVIADAARPVALAGVMGGAGSEIRATTKTVLLESAGFRPGDIRAAARKVGLSTESSYRFERGVNLDQVDWASRRAAELMVEHAGATLRDGATDVYPAAPQPSTIICRFDFVRDVTGVSASDAEIRGVFERLQLGVADRAAGSIAVTVPLFRRDLEREIDLVEEFARIHGLDKIPTPAPRAVMDSGSGNLEIRARRRLRDALAGLGLSEILNYSLVSEPLLDLFDTHDHPRRVAIPRPLSADQSVLRPSLIPQLVETLGRNRSRQTEEGALYEIGRVFQRDAQGQVVESEHLAIGLMGPVGRHDFAKRKAVEPAEAFQWLKGMVEQLCTALRITGWKTHAANVPYAEAGSSVELLVDGKPAGTLAIVARRIRKEWRLFDAVAVAELSVPALLAHALDLRGYRDLPAHPSVARDVAMIVPDAVRHEDIVACIKKAAPRELENIALFDIFTGAAIGAGRRSVAYSLTYRAADRTLTDEEANGFHEKVKTALRAELSAELREG